MNLSSVQSLKAELLSASQAGTESLVQASLAGELQHFGATQVRAFMSTAAGTRRLQRPLEGIALGVARAEQSQQYRLAIRLQRTGPVVSAMTEHITQRASGEVDIRKIGRIKAFVGEAGFAFYRQRRRPLRIGSSIGDTPPSGFVTAGTLGCFVVRRSKPFYISLLTNNHVIANENKNKKDAPVFQPGTLDKGNPGTDQVALLWKFIKLNKPAVNRVDAAIADILDEIEIDTKTVGTLGNLKGQVSIADLPPKPTVYKVGRTTGQTKGRYWVSLN
jgi:hypothetical protein